LWLLLAIPALPYLPQSMKFRNPKTTRGKAAIVIVTVLLILLVVIVARNFAGGPAEIRVKIPRLYTVDDPQFLRSMGLDLGPSVVGGNRINPLENGDEIFPAMLAAIRGAKSSITFETYIYWAAEIGRQFADALSERARAGVKVHVLVDWVGSGKMDKDYIAEMKAAGVQFRKFRPLRWYNLDRLNMRTHRKLLVVDGRIGFTGGVGIAAIWTGHAQDPDHWRDSHFRVEGPVVAQMQGSFMENWREATGEALHGNLYFPPPDSAGTDSAQVFSSSPASGGQSMELMYLLAITASQRSIYLESAYFIPDDISKNALVDALKRGVKVQIITPGPYMDVETVRRASRSRWGDLLEAGAEIYEYQPTMFHCKVMVVDERMVSVGSTNFDPRSFQLNDEASLNVYDPAFARHEIEVFERDRLRARLVTLDQWRARPFREKVWERVASLLGPAM
jgi:cardiolipin synthase